MIQDCSINIHPHLSSTNFVYNPYFRCIQCCLHWEVHFAFVFLRLTILFQQPVYSLVFYISRSTHLIKPNLLTQQVHILVIVTLLDKDKEYTMSLPFQY